MKQHGIIRAEYSRVTLPALCFLLALIAVLAGAPTLRAENLCARAKIEILQELSLERQAFEARMKITNGTPLAVEEIRVDVLFRDENGGLVWASPDPADTGAWFFLRPEGSGAALSPEGEGWALPDLPAFTGAEAAEAPAAEARWLIVPAAGAGGRDERGALYAVGARIRYTQGGAESTIDVAPDTVRVLPMPELALDYFLPVDVPGDDPGTGEVEESVPFPLGLRLRNLGAGTARGVRIDSGQPKIVENYQGLPLGFAIVGASVNGRKASRSLLADFGDLPPGATATAAWQMTCVLAGRFVSFGAKIAHADELGGELTSLIPEENLRSFALVKDVRTEGDDVPDFLAGERGPDGGAFLWALAVYTSDGLEAPVGDQSWGASLAVNGDGSYTLAKSEYDLDPGYVFLQLDDPFAGSSPLREVVRSDGRVLDPANAWLGRTKSGDAWRRTLNVFDVDTAGQTYLVRFRDDGAPGNRAPLLQAAAGWTVHAGRMLGFVVRATDPDGTTPLVYTGALPYGAGFRDGGDGTGRFEWTPSAGQLGSYTLQFVASDGDLTSERLVTVTVVGDGANCPPTVWDQYLVTDEDTALAGTLSACDPESDPLVFSVVKPPEHGELSTVDPATGSFAYTPAPNFHGADRFTFGASDGRAGSGLGVVHLTVKPVNDAPAAASAVIVTKQDRPGGPVLPQVLDPDGDTDFLYAVESPPAHGSAEAGEDGLTYVPAAGYFGPDFFTFRATDPGGLAVIGTASVTVVEVPFDLAATGLAKVGAALALRVANNRAVTVPGVAVAVVSRTPSGDVVTVAARADLPPGESTVNLDPGTAPAAGTVLSATVDPAGALAELDRFNNTVSLGLGLPLSATSSRPAVFAPGTEAVLSGRGFYRVSSMALPLQGGVVRASLARQGETGTVAGSETRTDRTGAWHLPLALPSAAGLYRLSVRLGDAGGEEVLEQDVPVDAALASTPPYPGPGGGEAVVVVADPAALEDWVASPGDPLPTVGEGGSGVRGGRSGSGDSLAVVAGGPAPGSRGGAGAAFDAQVVAGSLALSAAEPNAGERVQLSAVIRANDSLYGLPVLWRVTGPDGGTAALAPATWHYVNGDLHVFSFFTPPAVGTYTVGLALAPGFADADAGNDRAASTLTAKRPNHAPVMGTASIPARAWTGETVRFSAEAADDDGDELTYTWDFGDGAAVSGPDGQATHAYAEAGRWPVSVTVADGQGGQASRSGTLTVEDRPNRRPVIERLDIPAWAAVGVAASFGVNASDPDGDALAIRWDFGDGSVAEGATALHTFGASGACRVQVAVRDARGAQAQASRVVTVELRPNRAPVIEEAAIPARIGLGETAGFAVRVADPDGDPLAILWDFGDGSSGEGASVVHRFTVDGPYRVIVTAFDGWGGAATARGRVEVLDPEADAPALAVGERRTGLASAGAADGPVVFKILVPEEVEALTVSTDGGTGNVELYAREGQRVDRTEDNDGLLASLGPGNGERLSLPAPGGKTWYFLLHGDPGFAGVDFAVAGAGANRPPEVGPVRLSARARPGREAFFQVAASDPDGDALRAWWDFGDGTAGEGLVVGHAYPQAGAYAVTVLVGDGRGGLATAEGTVVVSP